MLSLTPINGHAPRFSGTTLFNAQQFNDIASPERIEELFNSLSPSVNDRATVTIAAKDCHLDTQRFGIVVNLNTPVGQANDEALAQFLTENQIPFYQSKSWWPVPILQSVLGFMNGLPERAQVLTEIMEGMRAIDVNRGRDLYAEQDAARNQARGTSQPALPGTAVLKLDVKNAPETP